MKSYIEPLSAAEALDVLDLYGVDTPGAFPSTEHEGCVEEGASMRDGSDKQ